MDLSTKAPPELDYYSLQVGISRVGYEVLELVYVLVQGTSLLIIGRRFQTVDSQGVDSRQLIARVSEWAGVTF